MAGLPPMEHYESRFAPPRTPTTYPAPAEPTSWPKVLGIICIVFGGLGILGGVWGVIFPLFNEWLVSRMPPDRQAAMEAAANANPYPVGTSLVMLAIAALLLAGGIGLVRRRGRAIGLLRVWAVVRILWVIVSTFSVGLRAARVRAHLVQPTEDPRRGGVVGVKLRARWTDPNAPRLSRPHARVNVAGPKILSRPRARESPPALERAGSLHPGRRGLAWGSRPIGS